MCWLPSTSFPSSLHPAHFTLCSALCIHYSRANNKHTHTLTYTPYIHHHKSTFPPHLDTLTPWNHSYYLFSYLTASPSTKPGTKRARTGKKKKGKGSTHLSNLLSNGPLVSKEPGPVHSFHLLLRSFSYPHHYHCHYLYYHYCYSSPLSTLSSSYFFPSSFHPYLQPIVSSRNQQQL